MAKGINTMAEATKIPVDSYTVNLALTQREAEVLRTVLNNIAGNANRTARGDTDKINRALRSIGVQPYYPINAPEYFNYVEGEIQFKDDLRFYK